MKLHQKIFALIMLTMILTLPDHALANSYENGIVILDASGQTYINPGTLEDLIKNTGATDPTAITELHIGSDVTGGLNPTDMAYINTLGNLQVLDVASSILVMSTGSQFCSGRGGVKFQDLREMTFPTSSVGNDAFFNCPKLETVNLPKAKTFGIYNFWMCTSLKTIHLPETTSVGDDMLGYCTSLESVSMPKLTQVGDYMFYKSNSQIDLILGPNIPTVPDWAWNTFTPGMLYVPQSAISIYDANLQPWDSGTTSDGKWGEWTINGILSSITFNANKPSGAGSIVNMPSSQIIGGGEYAKKPAADPILDGYIFGGWYTSSACNDDDRWNFNACQVVEDTTLYAKWSIPGGTNITHINFDYAYKSVKVGSSGNIASVCPYAIYPAAATDKTVSWTSSNTNVATISGGVITAHAEGKTVITVTANDATNGTIQTKMIVEVMDATAVSLSSSGKDIVGQVVDSNGMVLSNYCVTTYSDPLNTLTNSSGEFVFQGIPYTLHKLDVSNSNGQEVGRFSLNFNNTGNQSINVNNQTNTADISYSANTNYIDLKFQVNGASNDIDLITSDIRGTNIVPNPKTGEDA